MVLVRFWPKLWYWFRAAGAARGAAGAASGIAGLPTGTGAAAQAVGVAAYGSVVPTYPLMLVSGSNRTLAPS